ncbi:hypothetical protein EJK50_1769 [Moraxella catarrhalis]|nr:hypothetical protein EJK50_1769 [Moraxella catarrhalis]
MLVSFALSSDDGAFFMAYWANCLSGVFHADLTPFTPI